MEPRPAYQAPFYRGSGKLNGKIALITGGDSAIGRSVATLYAREGADVAIVYQPQEQQDAEETKRAIEAEGRRAMLIPGNVTQSNFCRQAVEQIVRQLGKLDILVNNAAWKQTQQRFEHVSEEQWDHTFKTNIYGYFYMAKSALPHLKDVGTIINTGSINGLEGNQQLIDYSATKGAIHAFTKLLAQSLIKQGVRVNCVAPGPVWTPLIPSDKGPEKTVEHGQSVPLQLHHRRSPHRVGWSHHCRVKQPSMRAYGWATGTRLALTITEDRYWPVLLGACLRTRVFVACQVVSVSYQLVYTQRSDYA